MAKYRVTLEVDNNQTFDMVAQIGDGGESLGVRLAGVLLAPDTVGLSTSLGLGIYGVSVASVERLQPTPGATVPKETVGEDR